MNRDRDGRGRSSYQGPNRDMDRGESYNERSEPFRNREEVGKGTYYRKEGQNYGTKRRYEDRDMLETEGDLRSKLIRNRDETKGREIGMEIRRNDKEILCFNCNMAGHHQGACTNSSFCYNCKTLGHKAMVCPMKRGLTLCGYGFPGAAFHMINFPTKQKTQKKEVMGLLTILEGTGDRSDIDKEIAYLFRDKDNWKIREIEHNEFLITFPDEDMRTQLTRFKHFGFETAPITAKVKNTDVTPDVSAMLQTVWVKVYNWDPEARVEHILREIAYIAGYPEMVDLQSLNRGGPVRIKLTVRDPELIRGET